jgi:hypothetical protein
VLHVHDLADYVSEEAVIAGKAASKFIRGEKTSDASVSLSATDGIRYTVPQRITSAVDTTVYFRVSDVYRDRYVVVMDGDKVIYKRKKLKLAPGEMETVKLTADQLRAVESGKLIFKLTEV